MPALALDQAEAQPSASPAPAVTPSIDPQAEAIAKELLLGTQRGVIDRTKLSKRIQSDLTPALLQGASKSLAPLGKLTGFTLLQARNVIGPMTHKSYVYYTFLATFQKQKMRWWVAFNQDGKVEGMLFSPDVAHMSEQQLIPALQARLQHDAKAGTFAGAALLAQDGKTVFAQAYGLADRAKKIPNTLDTRFRIGSMNKMFTAVAILQLVQAGKIGLDDPLVKYIPNYPNQDVATKVTIHQLLTHTGGTGDIFGPDVRQASPRTSYPERLRRPVRQARPQIRAGQPMGIQQLRLYSARRRRRKRERRKLLRLRARAHLSTRGNDRIRIGSRRAACSEHKHRLYRRQGRVAPKRRFAALSRNVSRRRIYDGGRPFALCQRVAEQHPARCRAYPAVNRG